MHSESGNSRTLKIERTTKVIVIGPPSQVLVYSRAVIILSPNKRQKMKNSFARIPLQLKNLI